LKARILVVSLFVAAHVGGVSASDRSWENPVFHTEEEAVAAARRTLVRADGGGPAALSLFVDLSLAQGDIGGLHPSSAITREVVENMLITHPTAFVHNEVQRRTMDRFREEIPRQRAVLERRLARFGYPELPGLVYCRLVDDVDAFAGLRTASSDRMTQVGGVTYYCRYMVLPLSYVGEESLRELRRSAALNPSLDVDQTIRRWQRQSIANLINTLRHELVHVHTNSTLDVPVYTDRGAYPTWFHEGTATYLAADPHSGLSKDYQEYQELFFYLVQRHGVRKLQTFYALLFGGSDVSSALSEVYAIAGTEQLFARSGRWHHAKELIKTVFWIAALAMVVAAFRGSDRPHIGGLQMLAALALALAAATGLAEHLCGLRGPEAVLAAKLAFGLLAVVFGYLGARRIRRHTRRLGSST
jgi:hypothetical protein